MSNYVKSIRNCTACPCTFNFKIIEALIYFNNSPDGSCSYCPGIQGFSVSPQPASGTCHGQRPDPHEPVFTDVNIYPICSGASGAVAWLNAQVSGLIANPSIPWNALLTATFLSGGSTPASTVLTLGVGASTAYLGAASGWGFNTETINNPSGATGPDWQDTFYGPDCYTVDFPCNACSDWGGFGVDSVTGDVCDYNAGTDPNCIQAYPGVPTSSTVAFYAQVIAVQTNCPSQIETGGGCCDYDYTPSTPLGNGSCPSAPSWNANGGGNPGPYPFEQPYGKCDYGPYYGASGGTGPTNSGCTGLGWVQYAVPTPDFNFCNTPDANLCWSPQCWYTYGIVGPYYGESGTGNPGCVGCGEYFNLDPDLYYGCPTCNSDDPFYGDNPP